MNARRLLEAKKKEFGFTDRLKETRTTKPKPEADFIDIEKKKKLIKRDLDFERCFWFTKGLTQKVKEENLSKLQR
ncbi:MAG: hypothetical protein CM15mV85_220 [uncultured marine virus]|nr:MAG: hypothetical protein CM15mV85_220 [uncultured marine virus]